MIIPRFLLNKQVSLLKDMGVTGLGKQVSTLSWTKRCYIQTKQVKIKNTNGTYTNEAQYTILLEKSDLKLNDILKFGDIDIKITEIPSIEVHSSSKYMEGIGYGQKV